MFPVVILGDLGSFFWYSLARFIMICLNTVYLGGCVHKFLSACPGSWFYLVALVITSLCGMSEISPAYVGFVASARSSDLDNNPSLRKHGGRAVPTKLRFSINNIMRTMSAQTGVNLGRPTSQLDLEVLCAVNKNEKIIRLHKDVQENKDIYPPFNPPPPPPPPTP